jgi:hypothetical protein
MITINADIKRNDKTIGTFKAEITYKSDLKELIQTLNKLNEDNIFVNYEFKDIDGLHYLESERFK